MRLRPTRTYNVSIASRHLLTIQPTLHNMGNESSTEVVQDEAKFLEGLQGMCVSMRWLYMYDRLRVRAGSAVIYLLHLLCHALLLLCTRCAIARFRPCMDGIVYSRIVIARFIINFSLIIRSLDDPDVKAVDEQVNAGTSWAVSYV